MTAAEQLAALIAERDTVTPSWFAPPPVMPSEGPAGRARLRAALDEAAPRRWRSHRKPQVAA